MKLLEKQVIIICAPENGENISLNMMVHIALT